MNEKMLFKVLFFDFSYFYEGNIRFSSVGKHYFLRNRNRKEFLMKIKALWLGFIVAITPILFNTCVDNDIPVITINTQPSSLTGISAGCLCIYLTVEAGVIGTATLRYQWFSNTFNSNTVGIAITGATTAQLTIPTSLTAGTYYFFCEVSDTASDVAWHFRNSQGSTLVRP